MSYGDLTSLYAYKILDIYYNETTNEMTYGFTQKFQEFVNQIPESDKLFYNLTIEKYQELTSDNSNGTASTSVTTTSTLNELASKYATYIRNDENAMVTTFDKNGNNYSANVEVGSYLILNNKERSRLKNEYMTDIITYNSGIGVANVIFESSNGEWTLPNCQVNIKVSSTTTNTALFNNSFEELISGGEHLSPDITYSAGKELFYYKNSYDEQEVPTNTNLSIKQNTTIMKKISQREIIFPKGLTYDLNDIYVYFYDENDNVNITKAIIKDNSIYYDSGIEEVKHTDFTQNTDTNSIILYDTDLVKEPFTSAILFFKLKTNDNIKLGTTTNGNTITTNAYYLKDAYVDISGMSQEEAEAKVLGVGTLTNTVYTYGVQVTNKEKNTLLELNGAKFQIYAGEGCTEEVGEFEITENGTYTFIGLNDTTTYCLKQTKAPTGYKLLTGSTELNPTSLNKEVGYYVVEVANEKMGLLPTTGGLGTILYTTFGLLIIVIGSIIFIRYRKRQTNS